MLKKDLDEYKRLDEVFNNECTRVCRILREWKPDFNYAEEYVLDDNRVICKCDKYLGYGCSDTFEMNFPTQLLTYSEKELREYVDNKVEAEKKIKEINERKIQQEKEERERAEYERLKTKFGE